MVKNKNVQDIILTMCDVKIFLTFTSLNLVLLWQLFYLFCSSIVINTIIVTAGNFEPQWKGRFGALKSDSTHHFFEKCLYQVRVNTVFTVFRLLTDFVCLYTYEFWLSLCKIARSSVILLLPLFWEMMRSGKWFPCVFKNVKTHIRYLKLLKQIYN